MTKDIQDYFKRLAQHDWFYMMADDNRSYDAGRRQEQILAAAARDSSTKQAMYQAWCDWRNENISRADTPRPTLAQFEPTKAA